MSRRAGILWAFVVALTIPSLALAQATPTAFDGPAAPVAPATINRDEAGRATVRATRLTSPPRIDGRLDEAIYTSTQAIAGFRQQDPVEGADATEATEFWLFFDDDALYLSFRLFESRPDALVANEMRRDSNNIFQNDHVAWLIDPFYDRRNGVEFAVNSIGGRWDGQVSNESQANADWNPIWDVKVGRFERGWTVEAVIPFKSLRYRPGGDQVWGLNVRRTNKGKNEVSYLTKVPRSMGMRGLFRSSLAATLVGVEVPGRSRNLEIKPYAISSLTSDLAATPHVSNAFGKDVGADVKYGLTENLTADLTWNTDFAQVEADEQQVNLTRFGLFFPEKREFFLENQGLFGFGGVATSAGGDVPTLFYSRRIGLEGDRARPIEVGGRVTGRVGRYSVGALNITSRDDTGEVDLRTNFSVARVKRDILGRSSVGVIMTQRSRLESGAGSNGSGSNQVYGVDGTFAFGDLAINTYWAQTRTTGLSGDNVSYRAQLDYAGDRYGVMVEQLAVGDNFAPQVGYVRRDDMRKSSAQFRFSPRPRSSTVVRRYSWTGTGSYIENGAGRVDARGLTGEFAIEFQSGDRFSAGAADAYEFIPRPARIVGLTVPVGGYDSSTASVGMQFGRQRRVAGTVLVEHGTFYGGHRTSLTLSQGRLNVTSQLSLEPIYVSTWADLPVGASTIHLTGSRVTYTMTPAMFVSALVQYNTGVHAVSTNVRLRWEYRPGSELFVVYNEQRDTLAPSFPGLVNRALVVKINRLFRP